MNCLFVGGPADGTFHLVPDWALHHGRHYEIAYYPFDEGKPSWSSSIHEPPKYDYYCAHLYRCVEYTCDSTTWYIFVANEYKDWQLINMLILGYKKG